MRLVDAFCDIQPVGPDAPAAKRDRLQTAARILLQELEDLARREMRSSDFSAADRDTVVQTVAYRLVKAGPRGRREGDPQRDGEVRGWLSIAVRNASRDLIRRRARFAWPTMDRDSRQPADPVERLRAGEPTDDTPLAEQVDRRRAEALLEQSRRTLYALTVPAIVARKNGRSPGAGDRFKETIDELRRAVRDSLSIEDLARQSLEADGMDVDPSKIAARRAALDKRFQRAREACLEAIDADLRGGAIDEDQVRATRLVLQHELYVQQRSDGVVAKARRKPRTDMRGRRTAGVREIKDNSGG